MAHVLGTIGWFILNTLIWGIGVKVILFSAASKLLGSWVATEFSKSEIRQLILEHYQAHPGHSVAGCEQGKCAGVC